MDTTTLLADPTTLRLETFVSHEKSITVVVRSIQPLAACPLCQQPSGNLHSNYVRRAADLPWQGVAVSLKLHTRKFRCRNELCSRKIFCERLPNVVAVFARKTARLNQVLTFLAFALGGEMGAKTSERLALKTSGDTLLRRIRQHRLIEKPEVKILGVDDFSFRRGVCFGTILVDLEKRQPIDLLPDREAETLRTWLAEHPEVEIISRDRASAYADGSRRGAPQAMQVADRWHLLKNITEVFEKLLQRHDKDLRAAAKQVVSSLETPLLEVALNESIQVVPETASEYVSSRSQRERRQQFHARRLELYRQVKELQKGGHSIRQIAKHLGLNHSTAARFCRADQYPIIQRGKRGGMLDKFDGYLRRRWNEGCRNAAQLYREILEQGFRGSRLTLRRHVQLWHKDEPEKLPPAPKVTVPSLRSVVWLLLKESESLTADEHMLRDQILETSVPIRESWHLVESFRRMIINRESEKFDDWIDQVEKSEIRELRNFAMVMKRDESAVRAALSSEWSNGQVEGQVNRLKFIKRQMFGRAKFDLLRARVLHQF